MPPGIGSAVEPAHALTAASSQDFLPPDSGVRSCAYVQQHSCTWPWILSITAASTPTLTRPHLGGGKTERARSIGSSHRVHDQHQDRPLCHLAHTCTPLKGMCVCVRIGGDHGHMCVLVQVYSEASQTRSLQHPTWPPACNASEARLNAIRRAFCFPSGSTSSERR